MSGRTANLPDLDLITELTTAEMLQLLGWQQSRVGRWLAEHPLQLGVARFARHVLGFEGGVQSQGWAAANRQAASRYLRSLHVSGAEFIPARGPLLLAANHPGITDFMALSAAAGRDDLAVLAYTRPFLCALPGVSSHILHLAHEPGQHFQAVRAAIRHLRAGQAVLSFPAGTGEPDPQTMPGAVASLESWQPSVGLLMRCVPGLQIVPALVSGVLWPRTYQLGFVQRLPSAREQMRVAGTLQVMWQTVRGRPHCDVRVDFGPPLMAEDLGGSQSAEEVLACLTDRMRSLLAALPAGTPNLTAQPTPQRPPQTRKQTIR